MGVQFLIFFRILKDMVNLSAVTTMTIEIDGEKEHVSYHDGQDVNAEVTYTFGGPIPHQM
jgi:hypothetical protein